MKKHYIFSILFAVPFLLEAQNTQQPETTPWKPSRGYFQFNGAGNNGGSGAYLHFKNRWVAFASYGTGTVKPQHLPYDYQPEERRYFNGEIAVVQPHEEHRNYVLGMGRILTPANGRAWIMVTGGLSYTEYTSQIFTKQERKQSSLYSYSLEDAILTLFSFGYVNRGELVGRSISSNYSSEEKESSGVGGSLGLQANLNLFRFMGLHGGSTVYFNHGRLIPTANLGLNIGYMRPRKPSKR